jgi:hypothetical protein
MDGKKGAERADGVDQTTTIQEEVEERDNNPDRLVKVSCKLGSTTCNSIFCVSCDFRLIVGSNIINIHHKHSFTFQITIPFYVVIPRGGGMGGFRNLNSGCRPGQNCRRERDSVSNSIFSEIGRQINNGGGRVSKKCNPYLKATC